MKLGRVIILTQVGHASAVADHAISTGHNIHFEVLASGRCDLHCKIKETLFIGDLKPILNNNVGSEKLWLTIPRARNESKRKTCML